MGDVVEFKPKPFYSALVELIERYKQNTVDSLVDDLIAAAKVLAADRIEVIETGGDPNVGEQP